MIFMYIPIIISCLSCYLLMKLSLDHFVYSYNDLFCSQTIVAWKMKPPEKKPLIRRDEAINISRISRSAGKTKIEPIKALSDFQEVDKDSFC